jgi:hypothetical protein
MQFVTGRGREGFVAYAFVEDNDDVEYYQHALTSFSHISYIRCGGKNNVLSVFKKLNGEGLVDGQLFFVDRDCELEPFEHEREVYRTPGYSWESSLLHDDAIVAYLPKRIRPSMTSDEMSSLLFSWNKTLERFEPLVRMHSAMLAAVEEKAFRGGDVSKIHLCAGAVWQDEALLPNDTVHAALTEKQLELVRLGLNQALTDCALSLRLNLSLPIVGRGKTLFQLFVTHLKAWVIPRNKTVFGEQSSALAYLKHIRWDWIGFDNIRVYARERGVAEDMV